MSEVDHFGQRLVDMVIFQCVLWDRLGLMNQLANVDAGGLCGFLDEFC
jgi:hypothetical protein